MRALSLLIFFSCIYYGSSWVRSCYSTKSFDRNYKPLYSDGKQCNGYNENAITTCYKQTGDFGVYYGCDNDKEVCSGISNSTCKTRNKVHICCCDTDLCNSAGFSSIFSVATIISAFYAMF